MTAPTSDIPETRRGPGRPRDEERTERRRAEILEATVQLFAECGYAQTDLQELANRLGVGKGTVYRYFATKEELFFAAVDYGMCQLTAAVDAAADAAPSSFARIEAAIRAYLLFFDSHPEIVELLIQERAQFRDRKQHTYFVHCDRNIEPWRALLQNLMDDGVLRPMSPEKMTDVISNLLYGTMFTNYFTGRAKPLVDQCDDILDVLYHGLLSRGEGE